MWLMATGVAPAIANLEQKVCRKMWMPPVTFSRALRRRIHFGKAVAKARSKAGG